MTLNPSCLRGNQGSTRFTQGMVSNAHPARAANNRQQEETASHQLWRTTELVCKPSVTRVWLRSCLGLALAHLGSRFVFRNVLAKLVGAGCVRSNFVSPEAKLLFCKRRALFLEVFNLGFFSFVCLFFSFFRRPKHMGHHLRGAGQA